MRYAPTESGGRVAEGKTPYGDYRVEMGPEAAGRECRIIDEQGNVVGRATMTMRAPQPSVLGQLAHGAAGLAKHALGVGKATPEVKAERLAICDPCEHSRPKNVRVELRRCGVLMDAFRPSGRGVPCGCGLNKKAGQEGDDCLKGKWPR